jgi:hypothetical protein
MNISPTLQRTFSRSVLQVQKYSPQILTAVGVAGLITAGVLAAKQTLKLERTLDDAKDRLDAAKPEDADENSTAVRKAYVRNVFDLAKLYWAPVTLATGSTVLILVGHNILHKRNIAIIGAYKSLEEAFSAYRKRIVEEYGPEADEKVRYGIRDVTTVDENGKKLKVREIDDIVPDYLFEFGPGNDNWNGHHEHNLFFVTRFQNIFNDKLQAHGHVFLNEVTDALGLPRTPQGQVTGWLYKKGTGDDYIDFRIRDLQDEKGYILLDFNVDGIIFDKI